ncbi:hypothetical protein [Janibacter melonis]|uniref:hypothetical protein n=1 Tax=Janibacter melonis TaxID=262209 RepID=UPI001E50BB79|nr:hypothetical protein [Janibacter melonis]MCB5991746.1 hypothetical protein [Janibacter melonis]
MVKPGGQVVRRVGVAGVAVVVMAALSSCGARTADSAAEELASAIADGSVSEHPELFDPAPSAKQVAVLDGLHQKCDVDEDSVGLEEGSVTPFARTMAVKVECDGKASLIGAVVIEPSSGRDSSSDFLVDPGYLPGGQREGEFSRSGLPDEIKHIDRL